jgi:hypothetical protein
VLSVVMTVNPPSQPSGSRNDPAGPVSVPVATKCGTDAGVRSIRFRRRRQCFALALDVLFRPARLGSDLAATEIRVALARV